MAESEWPSKFYQPFFFCLPPSLFTIAFLTRFTPTKDSIPASITDDQLTEKSSSREETNSLDDNSAHPAK